MGMLQIVDKHRGSPHVTAKAMNDEFQSIYKRDPCDSDFAFCNQHTFLALLFATVVFTREAAWESLPVVRLSDLDEAWGIPGRAGDLRSFVRCIRNALAHGDLEANPDLSFTFNAKANGTDSIRLDSKELQAFATELGYWLITGRLDRNEGS